MNDIFEAVNGLWVGIVKLALWIAYVVATVHYGAKIINDISSGFGKVLVLIIALAGLLYATIEIIRY